MPDEAETGIWTFTPPAVVLMDTVPPLNPAPPLAVMLPLASDTMPSAWMFTWPPTPAELEALMTALVPPSWLKASAVRPVVTIVTVPALPPLAARRSIRPVSFMLFAMRVTVLPCAST